MAHYYRKRREVIPECKVLLGRFCWRTTLRTSHPYRSRGTAYELSPLGQELREGPRPPGGSRPTRSSHYCRYFAAPEPMRRLHRITDKLIMLCFGNESDTFRAENVIRSRSTAACGISFPPSKQTLTNLDQATKSLGDAQTIRNPAACGATKRGYHFADVNRDRSWQDKRRQTPLFAAIPEIGDRKLSPLLLGSIPGVHVRLPGPCMPQLRLCLGLDLRLYDAPETKKTQDVGGRMRGRYGAQRGMPQDVEAPCEQDRANRRQAERPNSSRRYALLHPLVTLRAWSSERLRVRGTRAPLG